MGSVKLSYPTRKAICHDNQVNSIICIHRFYIHNNNIRLGAYSLFKPPWKELIEKILTLASITARIEFGLAKAHGSNKPTYAEFKERSKLRASEITRGRQPYLQNDFNPFNSYFGQCMIALRDGSDASLEKIVKREYEKL